MNAEVGEDPRAYALQKAGELGAAMARVKVADHFAGADVQGCEQGGGSVAIVVMGLALGTAG